MQHHIIEVTNAAFIPHVRNLIEEGRTVRFRAMGWSMRPMIEHARDEVLLGGYGEEIPNVTTLCWQSGQRTLRSPPHHANQR